MPKFAVLFQSTHPCGVRLSRLSNLNHVFQFQSTHPCGVRLRFLGSFIDKDCFNPRTRVGCDRNVFTWGFISVGFNPRTRVGCDAS